MVDKWSWRIHCQSSTSWWYIENIDYFISIYWIRKHFSWQPIAIPYDLSTIWVNNISVCAFQSLIQRKQLKYLLNWTFEQNYRSRMYLATKCARFDVHILYVLYSAWIEYPLESYNTMLMYDDCELESPIVQNQRKKESNKIKVK